MELALLTDAYIVISIYDLTENRATTFQSHEVDPDFGVINVEAHEHFIPDDVSLYIFIPLVCKVHVNHF